MWGKCEESPRPTLKVMRDTCLIFEINIYIYIYSIRKIERFLRNNTALIFKFIYIHPFIRSIKLQSINKKGFLLKYGHCIFPGFMLNLQDLKNTSKFSTGKNISYLTEEHAKFRPS